MKKGNSSLLCILPKLKSILINNLNSGIDFLNLMKKVKFIDMHLHMENILFDTEIKGGEWRVRKYMTVS